MPAGFTCTISLNEIWLLVLDGELEQYLTEKAQTGGFLGASILLNMGIRSFQKICCGTMKWQAIHACQHRCSLQIRKRARARADIPVT
jgi:hypothetical protein